MQDEHLTINVRSCSLQSEHVTIVMRFCSLAPHSVERARVRRSSFRSFEIRLTLTLSPSALRNRIPVGEREHLTGVVMIKYIVATILRRNPNFFLATP